MRGRISGKIYGSRYLLRSVESKRIVREGTRGVRSLYTEGTFLRFEIRANEANKSIGLTTKRLRILSIPPNDKVRNHLVASPIVRF